MTRRIPAARAAGRPAHGTPPGTRAAQWKKRSRSAAASAASSSGALRCAGSVRARPSSSSASAPNVAGSMRTPPSPVNHPEHQRSATAFHAPSGARRSPSAASVRSFLPHLLQRVARLRREGEPRADGRRQRVAHAVALEERHDARPPPCAGRRRTPREVRQRRAHQAVARAQVVVEKRQRPIAGERRQPQRQAPELDGHGVEVDAEQAALRDRPAEAGAVPLVQLRGGTIPSAERRLVRAAR
jgi:hypothetical protein